VVGSALAMARSAYVASPPLGIFSEAAAVSFFDTIFRFLRNSIRTVALLGLVLTVGAALAGPSPVAVRMRNAIGGGFSALGLDFGPASYWAERHRLGLDVTIVSIAAILLLSTDTPTPGLVLGLALGVLVGFLLVELVVRARASRDGTPTAGAHA
jgi:hypothetical protein